MNLPTAANHQIQPDMRNESPEDSLGDRKRQRNQNQSQKRRHAFFDLPKVDPADALEHSSAHQNQNDRRQQRQLESAENVQLEKHALEIRQTQELRRCTYQTQRPGNDRYDRDRQKKRERVLSRHQKD